ncbi:MAG: alpha-hydroxy acid oxidase [Actinomycetota bacterium]
MAPYLGTEHAGTTFQPKSVPSPTDLNLEALEVAAREVLGTMAYSYFAGGAEEERLLAEASEAWQRHLLFPRVLRDVSLIDTSTTILGQELASPIIVAPTALHGLATAEGEVASARGAAQANTIFTLSSLSNRSLSDVAATRQTTPQWMQLYVLKDRGATADLVAAVREAGFGALMLTVDAPVAGLRSRELRQRVHLPDDLSLPNLEAAVGSRPSGVGFMAHVAQAFDPALDARTLEWLVEISGLPVIVKGVVRGDDAVRCFDLGAAGVVVSNHGARQLDGSVPTAAALAPVVDAAHGRGPIFVDGGIRSPSDVVRALSLGADAVLLGRPILYALAVGGSQGVTDLLEWFQRELLRTMALCGATTLAELDRTVVGA